LPTHRNGEVPLLGKLPYHCTHILCLWRNTNIDTRYGERKLDSCQHWEFLVYPDRGDDF
jgi:hypothetical protein